MVDGDREWLPPGPPATAAAPVVAMPVDSGMMPPPPLSWSPYAFCPPVWSTTDPTTKTRVRPHDLAHTPSRTLLPTLLRV